MYPEPGTPNPEPVPTMRFVLKIPQAIFDAMIAQAQAELPNECVGLLAGHPDGLVVERYPLVNALADPRRYESEPRSLFEAEKRRRAQRLEFLAVYHSHPTSPAIPSKTDLERRYSEDVMCVIISLQSPKPDVRGYWLAEEDWESGEFVTSEPEAAVLFGNGFILRSPGRISRDGSV